VSVVPRRCALGQGSKVYGRRRALRMRVLCVCVCVTSVMLEKVGTTA